MQLFIDTNIYLDYFRQSSEQLQSLRVLEKLLNKKKLTLLVPTQVKEEYLRNKEKIVEETRKVLISQFAKFSFNPPTLIKEWKETKNIRKQIDKIKRTHDNLLKKYDQEIEKEKSIAESLISKIFSLGNEIKENKNLLEEAHTRYLKGNPPRKNDNSYGDAIIWESLLSKAVSDDLSIVSKDSDFISFRREEPILRIFLQKEWNTKTSKKINLFTSLGEFINSFEKKRTIKKEIIEKEKSTLESVSSPLLNWNLEGSSLGTMSGLAGTTVFSPIISSSEISGCVSSPWTINSREDYLTLNTPLGRKINFCPHCGKDVSNQWREHLSRNRNFSYNSFGSSQISFICPYCNKNIS